MNKSSKSILINQKQQQELDVFGFVKIGLLDNLSVVSINQLFERLHSKRTDIPYDKLFTCIQINDSAYKENMHEGLNSILKPFTNQHLKNALFSTYTFQIKGIGEETELFVHQDWSHSNEIKGYNSYTLWIPLIDTNEQNGTLYVVPGSHKHHKSYRGHGIQSPIDDCREAAKKYHTPLKVQAGEVLLFDTSIFHYSPDNLSNKVRISVMINLTNQPNNFSVFLPSQKHNERFVEEFHVPPNYFLLYNDFMKEREEKPVFGKSAGVYKNNLAMVNEKKLDELYGN